jgi:hypothetical protein
MNLDELELVRSSPTQSGAALERPLEHPAALALVAF